MRPSNPVCLIRRGPWLIAEFAEPHEILSWALVHGGRFRTQAVAWYQVRHEDLAPPVEPRQFLEAHLESEGLPGAVGMLTSRELDACVDCEKTEGPYSVRVITTVGLSNAVRVGDPPSRAVRAGTINLLCRVGSPLTEEAMAEALALCAEARTTALLELAIPSTRTGAFATGTGTDCIVVAAPAQGTKLSYCGKHTALGSLIGSVTIEAIARGAEAWKKEGQEVPEGVFRQGSHS